MTRSSNLPEVHQDAVNAIRQIDQCQETVNHKVRNMRWEKAAFLTSLAGFGYSANAISLVPDGHHITAPWPFVIGLSTVAGFVALLAWCCERGEWGKAKQKLREARYVQENVLVGGEYMNVHRLDVLDGGMPYPEKSSW